MRVEPPGGTVQAVPHFEMVSMPLYFFNLRDGHELDEDEEGIELPDLEAARAEALATVEELRGQLADVDDIMLEITDETGRRLLTVPFKGRAHGGRR